MTAASLEGKTSVFTVANSGVGLPMETSSLRSSPRNGTIPIYKKLADGEITLVQFSADDNDPNEGSDGFGQYKGYLCG